MTLDYNDPDEIVLGKDLKIGDCVRSRRWSETKNGNDMGIIVATTFHNDSTSLKLRRFYEDKPAYEIYEINCPCDGTLCCHLDPEQEFKVIKSRKDILYTYKTIDYQLLKRSADLMKQSNNLDDIKKIAVNRMNDRCDILKRELEEEEKYE